MNLQDELKRSQIFKMSSSPTGALGKEMQSCSLDRLCDIKLSKYQVIHMSDLVPAHHQVSHQPVKALLALSLLDLCCIVHQPHCSDRSLRLL